MDIAVKDSNHRGNLPPCTPLYPPVPTASVYRADRHLDREQQVIEVLHRVPLRLPVVPGRVQAGPLDGASVQGQLHGLRVQIYGLVTDRLVHVAVQLICKTQRGANTNPVT